MGASVRHLFEKFGPVHLTSVNWKCPHHQRSVAACLVQGTYVLERDRRQKRHGSEARVPAWWEFFHLEPVRPLVDVRDNSIFGAIYEFKPLAVSAQINPTSASAPKFVIAFRGTVTKNDLSLDLHIFKQDLYMTSTFAIAMQAISKLASDHKMSKIWLAGHSLGSAMATIAGKNVVKAGFYLDTFLFNQPFIAAPIGKIKNEKVRVGFRIAGSLFTAGLAIAVGHCNKSEEKFVDLALWVPNLFVNRGDIICSAYVGYFEHRRKMAEIGGGGGIGRLATQNSVRDLVMNVWGEDSDPVHLPPSANLTVNSTHSTDFRTAHCIQQWWKPDSCLRSVEYRYE